MLTEESSGEADNPPDPATVPPSEAMETVPVTDGPGEDVASSGQLLEACPSCGTLMDVTDQAPFAEIFCPSCGQRLRARKQFNNYRLVELIGEGGMGSVFKATDCNLNRHVALKILKKEVSANAGERAKLKVEARMTASVNHPHVVKVFSFGEDHGQFYLAMELVEKGSLDQLMGFQRRVAEIQILDVGIQIAEGLEAALECGLIHRDIKPGNILFADAHTAKLVDFGLAIVMDEAAQARGEIWGTPYYIAPEKLDNQPEDFRSDIYSLGGTLFHALAGRPPYEAETASMVALKQLKSQPVSLQAFAPEVSSETAYVINRMLAKNPAERYSSYRELIEHLSYARHKLAERTQKPHAPKERVVMETPASRSLTGILSLAIFAVILLTGILLFLFRGSIFPDRSSGRAVAAAIDRGELDARFTQAIDRLADGQFSEAQDELERLADLPGVNQPQRNWIRMNLGLAAMLAGDRETAVKVFSELTNEGPYTVDSPTDSDFKQASFFVSGASLLANPDKTIPAAITRLYSNTTFEALGLFAFAMHDWELGDFKNATALLAPFVKAKIPREYSWMERLQPLAASYLGEGAAVASLEDRVEQVRDAAGAQKLFDELRALRGTTKSGGRLDDRLAALETKLTAKGAQ